MARKPRTAKKTTGIRIDLSNVSKAFDPNQEYAVRVTECTLEEGSKAPYFNLKLQGVEGGDYETSTMYHRASTSESSLWRLRPLLEAFGFEIPEGPLDLDAGDFIGREAMCSTYLDRYDGGSSVKPDEFWAMEETEGDDEEDEDEEDEDEEDEEEVEAVDLDELDDEQLVALAKAMGIKASTAKKAKAALKKADEDEVAKAFAELEGDDEEEEEEEEPAPKSSKKAKASSKKKKAVTEDDIQEMNEDELQELIESFELDLDLGDFKTLRKMKNAVIDAMEEGGHLES